jgi:hypothetical protein
MSFPWSLASRTSFIMRLPLKPQHNELEPRGNIETVNRRRSIVFTFVGRGILVEAALSFEAKRFAEKDYRFCAGFEENCSESTYVIDRG